MMTLRGHLLMWWHAYRAECWDGIANYRRGMLIDAEEIAKIHRRKLAHLVAALNNGGMT